MTSIRTLQHEIVHAIVRPRLGDTTVFMREGLAETLGRSAHPYFVDTPDDVTANFSLDSTKDLDYGVAARFTRFLIERYGKDKYFALYRALGETRRRLPSEIFERELGVSLHEAERAHNEQASRCTYQIDLCPLVISSTVSLHWSTELVLGTDSPEAIGFRGPEGLQCTVPIGLDIVVPGTYRLRTDPLTRLELVRCGTCAEQSQFYGALDPWLDGERSLDLALEAGSYVLLVSCGAEPVVTQLELTLLSATPDLQAPSHE